MIRTVGRISGRLLLLAGGVLMIMPVVWMLSSSLKEPVQIFQVPVQWIPNPIQPQNYTEGLTLAPFGRYFLNSIFIGVSVTAITLLFATLAGYGFAKFAFPGRGLLFIAVLSTLMIPFQAIMVPLYILVHNWGWLDSYTGLILPVSLSAFGVFLMRQFILSIPNELLDAARIDGANEIAIFARIVLPLCRAPMAALAIFTFLDNWNNLLWPLVVVYSVDLRTVTLGLTEFQTVHGTQYHYLMAVATVASLPVLVLFAILQRRFIRGIVLTGLKG